MRRARRAAAVLVLFAGTVARGHDFALIDTQVVLRADHSYQITLTLDVDALALGTPAAARTADRSADLRRLELSARQRLLAGAADRLRQRFHVRFDGRDDRPDIDFADAGAAGLDNAFGHTVRLAGVVPAGATALTFAGTSDLGAIFLTIVDQPSGGTEKRLLASGEESPAYRLDRAASGRDDANGDGGGVSWLRCVRLGWLHIVGFENGVPVGIDHMLFVLGLFLLSTRLRPLLWQVSAFTVAHTLTLGLSVYGVVRLPPRVVEPLIALSIAYVAVENLFTSELKLWRPALVFGFGLLHGLGFAAALQGLNLPRGQYLGSLLSFNAGVEAGQLTVIGVAVLSLGWFQRRAWYRRRVVVPLSAIISVVGLYWAVTRALGV